MLGKGFELLLTGMGFVFFFLGLQVLAMRALERFVRAFGNPAADEESPDADLPAPDELAQVAAAVAVARFCKAHGGRPWDASASR